MLVKGWDKWQTYRKDRGTPPWIKVYRNLMSNVEWVSLSDAEKGQLVSMWIIAADKSGQLPDDPAVLQRMCMLSSKPNIRKFKQLGFMVTSRLPSGNHVVTDPPEVDAPETETETYKGETETETKGDFPDWLPMEDWNAFLEMRQSIKSKPTPKAMKMLITKLDKLRNEGHDVSEVLQNSIMNNYKGLFEVNHGKQFNNKSDKPTAHDSFTAGAAAFLGLDK